MSTLALVNVSQLVTMAGPARPRVGRELSDIAIIRDGGMLIRDGIIERTGRTAEIRREIPSDAKTIDAGGCAVLPGFVDAHAHPVFGGDRLDEWEMRARGATYEEIAATGGGIRSTVRLTRAATGAELEAKTLRHAEWFLAGGTTTVEAKSGYGLSVEDELKMLRVVRSMKGRTPLEFVPTFLGAHAFPAEFADEPARYVDLVIDEMLPRVGGERFAEFCDAFCERAYFGADDCRRIFSAAKRLGLGIRVHADQLTNGGGAALAAELGAVTADHLEHTDAGGIAALKRGGVQPVLLPASVYALGKTCYPRARAMIDAGLAVVLATDFNPGSSPTPSMPMILSLAVTQMKMTPAEALTAATVNPAHSLRRGNSIGSLEPGRLANFSILSCADYREIAYYFGVSLIETVYVRGRPAWQKWPAPGASGI